jgi:hypothetical protein
MAYQGYGGAGKTSGAHESSPKLALVAGEPPGIDNPPLLAQETVRGTVLPDTNDTQPVPPSDPPALAAENLATPALPAMEPQNQPQFIPGASLPSDPGSLAPPPLPPQPPTAVEFAEQKYDEMLKDLGKFQDPSALRLLNSWSLMILQSMAAGKVPDEQRAKAREQHLDRIERMLSAVKTLKLAPAEKTEWLNVARQFVKDAQDDYGRPQTSAAPTTAILTVEDNPTRQSLATSRDPNILPPSSVPNPGNDPSTPLPPSAVPQPTPNLPPQYRPEPIPQPQPTLPPEPTERRSEPPRLAESTLATGVIRNPDEREIETTVDTELVPMPGQGRPGDRLVGFSRSRLRYQIAMRSRWLETHDKSPLSKAILKKLDEPFTMAFKDAALDKVLDAVRSHAIAKGGAPIPIYLDPVAFDKDGGKALKRTVKIQLDGVPLRTWLRLALKQLDLAYCVRDGVLIVSSAQGIMEELDEAEGAATEAENLEGENPRSTVPGEGNVKDPQKPGTTSF